MHAENSLGRSTPPGESAHRGASRPLHGRTATLRRVLGALLAFGALCAFDGGFYGLTGAKGVPTQWLQGSPFQDYIIPSLILVAVVGGTLLLAAVAVFARWPRARPLALLAALILLAFLAVQLSILGYVSWMQPTTAAYAVVLLTLGLLLPGPLRQRH